ncbi:hypothetical protein BDR05DRAFT_951755 [Suillus weaverae]|nr:hypothetical protein BDR05DRAFT_951755 [Suillus weaverae]
MDRLHSDPSLLVCPDFMSECYRASRMTFVSATITEAQAAESLRLVWVASNDDLKLTKGSFVELYYWTNNGLEDVLASYSTRDDDGMIPTEQDGSTVWISTAASRPSKHVVPDRFLLPADFAQAIPCIVTALEEHDWPKQHVLMLARFWGAIMTHPYWNSNDTVAQQALMIYQEEQRRAWHTAITLGKGAWDISIISDPTLTRLFDRVMRESRHHEFNAQLNHSSNAHSSQGDTSSNQCS